MLKIIRELGVKLSLAWDKKAASDAQSALGKLSSSMKSIGAQAAAAAGTMFGFAEATASNAHDLSLYSETLGISSERLQELGYAAKIAANVSREELIGALEGVSGTLDNVRKGNVDAAMAFNRLGLSTDIITNRNLKADQVMMMVSERLRKIQDPIARAAIANEIFGASGAKMLPLLMKGADGIAQLGGEARKMGLVFSDSAIKRQAAFQVQLNRTMEVVKNVGLRIGEALLPVVSKVLHQFSAWITVNKKLIAESLAGFIQGLTVLVPVLFKMAMGVIEVFKAFAKFVGGAENAAKILVSLFAFVKLAGPVYAFGKSLLTIAQFAWKVMGAFRILATAWRAFNAAVIGLRMLAIVEGFASLAALLNPVTIAIVAVGAALGGLVYYFKDTAWMKAFLNGVETYFLKAWNWIKEAIVSAGEAISGFVSSMGKITGISSIFSKIGDFLGFNSAAPAGATAPAMATANGAPANNNVQIQNTFTMPPGTTPAQAEQIVTRGMDKSLSAADLRNTRNKALGGAKN